MVPERQAFHPSQKAVKAVADSTVPRPRRSRAKYRDNKIVEAKPARPARKRRHVTRMDSLSDSKTSDGSDFGLEVPASRDLEVLQSQGLEVSVSQGSDDPVSQGSQDPKSQGSDDPVSQDSDDRVTQVSQHPMSLGSDDPVTQGSDVPTTVHSVNRGSEVLISENRKNKANKCPKQQPKKSQTKAIPTKEMPLRSTDNVTHDFGGSERMLMRQWLESEADGGTNPGLKWLDKNEGLIRINWRHGSRAEWSTSDVGVFKCWAQHTGRYSSNDPDYKRWKANFRCAVNSLQDVKEVKEKRSTKTGDPYKVYKLLPAVPPKKRRRESVKSAQSSSPENIPVVAEVSVATDITAAEPTESEPLPVDPLSQELFLQLMPLPSVGCESVIPWSSGTDLDCIPTNEDVENLVTLDVPLMCLDHCYANTTDAIAQIQPSLPAPPPPPPPPPAPFNDAIPLPVQKLIDASEEFQTMTSESENFENLNDLNVSELLGFADVNVGSVSSTNENSVLLLEMLQALMNPSGFIISHEAV